MDIEKIKKNLQEIKFDAEALTKQVRGRIKTTNLKKKISEKVFKKLLNHLLSFKITLKKY